MREIRRCGLAAAMMAALLPCIGAAQQAATLKEWTEMRVETKAIPFTVVYEFSREVGAGRLVTSRRGVPGKVIRTYSVDVKDGKPIKKTQIDEERTEPVSELVLMGRTGYKTSRGSFQRGRVLTMKASAYDPSPQTIPGTTGRTANGMKAQFGVVAVDPRFIPLGTLLFVEGYGFAIAADTGGAIKGNRIDLCYNSRRTALQFGRRTVRVHILKNA